MSKKEPTQLEIVVGALNAKRMSMRSNLQELGEPAVELPIGDIQTFKGEDGQWRAIIGMNKLIYLIDGLLRQS